MLQVQLTGHEGLARRVSGRRLAGRSAVIGIEAGVQLSIRG